MGKLQESLRRFDKAYCVNLDEATDRWALVQREFDIMGLDIERVPGIKPQTFPAGSLQSGRGFRFHAEYGCYLSHMECIKRGIQADAEAILIFEDDFLLVDNYEEDIPAALDELPDNWDMIFFGTRPVEPMTKISDNLQKMGRMIGAIGYGVSRKAMKEISDLPPHTLDNMYGHYATTHNVYTTKRLTGAQPANYSYNQKNIIDPIHIIRDGWRQFSAI